MIPKEKELKLIKIYVYICDVYQSSLKFYCQRFSNNATPIFTDQELLTVYLFCGAYQRYPIENFDVTKIRQDSLTPNHTLKAFLYHKCGR